MSVPNPEADLDAGSNIGPVVSSSAGEFARLTLEARTGSLEAIGQLVETYRKYLLLVANRDLPADLRAKVGASDLVQETVLAAQQGYLRFEGTTEEDFRRWLRRILLNRLARVQRTYFGTIKRQAGRERSLPGNSDSRSEQPLLVDPEITPRARALADEQSELIERALLGLPDRYREIIELRCFERRSFIETGELLQITPDAARKRWCRAIEQLRQQLETHDESR